MIKMKMGTVIKDKNVVKKTILAASTSSPSCWAAKIAVVAPAGMATNRVEMTVTLVGKFKAEQIAKTAAGIKMRRTVVYQRIVLLIKDLKEISARRLPIKTMEIGVTLLLPCCRTLTKALGSLIWASIKTRPTMTAKMQG